MASLEEFLSDLEARTGLPLHARNFDSRLRIQKAVYLFQAQGYSVDEGPFSYGRHHFGPYSPELAREYYGEDDEADLELGPTPPPEVFEASEEDLEVLADAIGRGTDFLEAASTLTQIANRRNIDGFEEAYPTFKRIKPGIDEEDAVEAWRFLKDHEIA